MNALVHRNLAGYQLPSLPYLVEAAFSANRITQYAKFGLGAVAGMAIESIAKATVFLFQKIGVVQEIDSSSFQAESLAKINQIWPLTDREAIVNAACPLEEIVKQINIASPGGHLTVFGIHAVQIGVIGVVGPLCEEIKYRVLIQDVLLKRVPKYIIEKSSSGNLILFNSNIEKAARIILTAGLFSIAHSKNKEMWPDSYVDMQMISAFAGGIICGILKETRVGFAGCLGAHITVNMIALYRLWSC